MRLSSTGRRSAQVPVLCGLLLTLCLAAGCSRGLASAPAPGKSKSEAAKTNALAGAQTNLSADYTSVFEDLPPHNGKDPFFPASHRRDPAPEAVSEAGMHVDPVLLLKAIVRTSKHGQAVINNQIFEAGEEQPVRVPNGHVKVKCIEISNDYVLIQVEGEAEPKRLLMEQKKN